MSTDRRVLREWGLVHPVLWRILDEEGFPVREIKGTDAGWVKTRRYAPRWLVELLRLHHPTPPEVFASRRWYKRVARNAKALEAAWRLGGAAPMTMLYERVCQGCSTHTKIA